MRETEFVPSRMDRIESLEQRLTALELALANQYVLNKYFIKAKPLWAGDFEDEKTKERKRAE